MQYDSFASGDDNRDLGRADRACLPALMGAAREVRPYQGHVRFSNLRMVLTPTQTWDPVHPLNGHESAMEKATITIRIL